MNWVYLLRCSDGSFYTGSARDLARRVREHLSGKGGRYTRSRRPVSLAASWSVVSWSDALRLEWLIKKLDHRAKEQLSASPGLLKQFLGEKLDSILLDNGPDSTGSLIK